MHKFAGYRIIRFFVCAGLLLLGSASCSMLHKSKAEKVETELEQSDSQAMSELKKAQKAHYKMQPRETRKMMKRSMRMSKRLNRGRKLS